MQLEMTSQLDGLPARELKRLLDRELESTGSRIPLALAGSPVQLKGIDPTVITAAVGATGALLGTLVSALLQVLGSRDSRIIEITSGKVTVRVPVGASARDIERAVACLRELEDQPLRIVAKEQR